MRVADEITGDLFHPHLKGLTSEGIHVVDPGQWFVGLSDYQLFVLPTASWSWSMVRLLRSVFFFECTLEYTSFFDSFDPSCRSVDGRSGLRLCSCSVQPTIRTCRFVSLNLYVCCLKDKWCFCRWVAMMNCSGKVESMPN